MTRALSLAALVALVAACGKDERRTPEREPKSARAAASSALADASTPTGDALAPALEPTSVDGGASGDAALGRSPEDAAAPALEAVASGLGADAADGAGEGITREACVAACQNALRVTLGELSAETAPAMRTEIERSLKEACPDQCVARGSAASVSCVGAAKTALELAGCPR